MVGEAEVEYSSKYVSHPQSSYRLRREQLTREFPGVLALEPRVTLSIHMAASFRSSTSCRRICCTGCS